MQEIFKDIPEYGGLYQVSNLGRVKSFCRVKEIILSFKKDKDGYLEARLSKNKKRKHYRLHRLVLLAFKGKSELQVNHKDGNKQNNRLDNLEYATSKDNVIHAWKIGLKKRNHSYNKGFKRYNDSRKIKIKQYTLDGTFIREWESISQASKDLNIQHSSIFMNLKGTYNTAGGFKWSKQQNANN